MIITLPIYIEEQPRGEDALPLFFARPLRYAEPSRRAEKMSRALRLLESDLRSRLLYLSENPEHEELAEWCAAQDYETATLELRLELKSGSRPRRFFFVGYQALDRKLWFTPRLPGLHFEVLDHERLADRASAVLTEHFRELERSDDEVELDEFALPERGKAFLTVVEIKITPACNAFIKSVPGQLSIFGGSEEKKPDGEAELRKVGRLLNSLYPDELPRALGRDAEVASLDRWLSLLDRRAILLVGQRQVGKTAIVRECLWRSLAKEDQTRRKKIWLVSPMRLISGMSHVGKWEERVHAICDYLERSDGVLYLDDLPGLFTAGQTACSDLNVAQLLKPRLERRSLRLLAEITPEAWRVVRERDRALVDLFHVLPVTEPIERETLLILVGVARECERQQRCEFALEVTPAAYELYRRFAGEAAFPGKAAEFLRRLAVKHSGAECSRTDALVEFRERSGLQLSLLDRERSLDRETILRDLQKQVAGQDHALQAFADVLLTLKARLNDPRRPLAVFLFVGPTGVGKTECAKAFAKYLFGSEERLLRFDMNEMAGAGAGLRLTGTPAEPDGLLTGAVRRQPFSVLLFDEIEKAAPEIFDLLLGVLDEGRLSDALGRVADFTNCLILLTSNLGVLESGRQISFGTEAREQDAGFVAAAEKFFRPEFFNRLDRILPFRPLQPEHLVAITRKLLGDLLQRDGLRQRQCLFGFSPSAIDRLAELGRHPQLGARALKRVIEREVAQPLAEQLAARVPTCPLKIELRCAADRFSLHSCELRPAERTIFWPEFLCRGEQTSDAILDAAFAALDRITAFVESLAPAGRVDPALLTSDQERYYHCREQIQRVEELLREAEVSAVSRPASASRAMAVSRPKPTKFLVSYSYSSDPILARAREAERLQQELAESETPDQELPENPLFRAVRELTFLEWMASEPCSHESVGVVIRCQGMPAFDWAIMLQWQLKTLLESHWGVQVSHVPFARDSSGNSQLKLWVAGVNLARLLGPSLGCYLFYGDDGKLHLLEVGLVSGVALEQWSESSASSEFGDDSTIVATVRRDGRAVDHRTGLVLSSNPEPEEFRAFHLAGLSLPRELVALVGDFVN